MVVSDYRPTASRHFGPNIFPITNLKQKTQFQEEEKCNDKK